MANGNDLRATLSVSLNQEAAEKELAQALKQLEKHPGMKALTINIKLDNKLVQALNQLKQVDTGLEAVSVQAAAAASEMNALGEAARAAVASASREWLRLGETLQQFQSLTVNANAKAAEAVTGANVDEQVVGNLKQTVEVMSALSAIATFQTDVLKGMRLAVSSLTTMYSTLRLTMGTVAASVRVAGAAFVMLGKALWPVALISGVIWGLSELYKAFSGTNDKTKESEKVNFNHINSLKQQRDELRQLTDEYQTLQSAQEIGYATLDQKQRLLSIQNDLVKSYGVSASGINSEGAAYSTSFSFIQMRIDALNQEIAAEHELNKVKLRAKDSERTDTLQNFESSISQDEAKIAELKKLADMYEERSKDETDVVYVSAPVAYAPTIAIPDNGVQWKEKRQQVLNEMAGVAEGIQEKRGDFQRILSETTSILKTEMDQYFSVLQSKGTHVSDAQRAFMEGLIDSIALNGKDLDSQINDIFTAYASLSKLGLDRHLINFNAYKESGNTEGMEEVRQQVLQMLDVFNEGTKITDSFRMSVLAMFDSTSTAMSAEDASKMTKNWVQSLSSLENAYKKLNAGEQLSASTVFDLVEQYPELSKYLAETNDFTFQRGQLLLQVIEHERTSRIEQIKSSIQTTTALQKELENKRRLRQQYLVETRGMYETETYIDGLTLEEYEQSKQNEETLNELNTLLVLWSKPINFGTGSSGLQSGGGEKYEPNLKLSRAQLEVDEYNRLLEENNDAIELAIAQGRAYDKHLSSRIQLYSNLASALGKLRDEQLKEQSGLRSKLTKTGLLDINGDVIANADKRLIELSKANSDKRLNYTAKELEDFLSRYVELVEQLSDTNAQLRAVTTDLADTLQKNLDRISSLANRKIDKAHHKISMLGEINTEEEKKLLAQYTNEIVKSLSQQSSEISKEMAKAQAIISDPKASKQDKNANAIYLESLKQSQAKADEELISAAEKFGEAQGEALVSGFDKQLEDLKYSKSLLGNVDTEEEKRKAVEIDRQIGEVLKQGAERTNKDIVELERKLSTQLSAEDRHRVQSKLEYLREYANKYKLEQVQIVSAWENSVKSSAKEAMDALEDYYQKQGKAVQKVLDDQLEDYRSFIEESKKLFKRKDEEVDYKDNHSKLEKEEAELRQQISYLSMDNSIEAQYKREQLEKELTDKLEEIRKLELDRTRSMREQNYDDLLKNKEDEIKVAKDAAEQKWQNDLATDMQYSALKQALLENNTAQMQNALLEFSNNVQLYMDAIGASIDRNLIEKLTDAQRFHNIANEIVGIFKPYVPPSRPPVTPNIAIAGAGLAESANLTLQSKNLKKFHEGGEVGVQNTTTDKWWKGMLQSNEVLSVLKKGEAVIRDPVPFVQRMIANVAEGLNAAPRFFLSGADSSENTNHYYAYDIRIDRVEGGEAGAKALFKHIKTQSQRGNRI